MAKPGDIVGGHVVPADPARLWGLVEALARDPDPSVGPLGRRFPGLALAMFLVALGDASLQRPLGRMVVERLVGSDEPAWRRAGLDVFWLAPRFFGYERLAGALRQHAGRGPDGVVPEADVPRDADWLRRVVLHQFRAGEVRALSDALKADMLAGWFEPLAVAHLIQADPHWLLTRAAALVTVNPGWEPVLREHFARLSEGARGALAAALKPRAEASLG